MKGWIYVKKITSVLLCAAIVCFSSVLCSAKTSQGYDYGDVNCDGVVDQKDALSLKKHIAQWENEDYNREPADVNGDDKVNISDLFVLQQYLSKIETTPLGPQMTARVTLFDGVNSVAEGNGTNIAFEQNSAGTVITLSGNGIYYFSGKMTGRIIVKYASKSDGDKITIVLNGAEITCNTDCPIWVDKAEKTVITTINKTKNTLTDNSASVSGAKSACIYADDDMTINGKGTLTVNAEGKNGIRCENDLKISDGTVIVNAGKNGVVGETSVTYKEATITIICDGDAIKTTDEESASKGFILMSSGTIYASCGDDIMQATRTVTITGGTVYYKFTADDISSCHTTKVGTTDANGNAVIVGTESIADATFLNWTE